MDVKVLKSFYDDYYKDILHRYDILKLIQQEEPVGRRTISDILKLNERFVRKECEYLQHKKYIRIESVGMMITIQGNYMLDNLRSFIREFRSDEMMEKKISQKLGIRRVIIASKGNQIEDEDQILGEVGGQYLLSTLENVKILGITGGMTMYNLVNHIKPKKVYEDMTIIPVRGGLGGNPMTESNLMAFRLKEQLKSKYSGIYLPDIFDMKEISAHFKDQLQTLDLIEQIDVLVFGVGNALEMARKRNLSNEKIDRLIEKEAVGEAFGHYFDKMGRMVYESKSLGVDINTYKKIPRCIAVAGRGKEDAIISIASLNSNLDLVITDSCANELNNKIENI